MDKDYKEIALQPAPGDGELQKQLKDKRIFGVYRDEEGTDRAIRQLHKLGYAAQDIYLYSKDEQTARKVTEKVNQDLNLMSCSDGSDFIGESYHQGDIVLCVRKDAELFQAQARTGAADHAETAAEVHEKVAEEKRSE